MKASVSGDSADKPQQSYIALISMAILSVPGKKMLLSDIYQYIMDNFPFYNNKDKAWRNSVRHNLSLNECFVKSGRADNGKGHYWAIHPACIEDFSKGDYRRRQARRRAKRSAATSSVTPVTSTTSHQAPQNMNYQYSIGYVPMTTVPTYSYHPYAAAAASRISPYQSTPTTTMPYSYAAPYSFSSTSYPTMTPALSPAITAAITPALSPASGLSKLSSCSYDQIPQHSLTSISNYTDSLFQPHHL